MYAEQHTWEYTSSDGIRSHYHRETAAENDFGKPQPLTYPYNIFMSDMQFREQQSINMPDHNEYVESIMARKRREYGFIRAPPYPLHGHDTDDHSKGAMQGNSSGSLRQPTAEDFLRSNHPLPAPPTEEYNSDQDLPVIEPDPYLPEGLKEGHLGGLSQQSMAAPKRHYTTAATAAKTSRISQEKPKHKRARSELIAPSHAPSLEHEPSMSEHHSTSVRVPTISSDMYQPALGGLQRVSGVQRRNSKRDRVKRFVKDLCPFRHERKFGRPQN
ncbi:hypothetical protein BKA58DRAFT_433959 [Alternaria rosae]|uniref:uncharacterized protein n=1 Tax=Alternaria rosae TaxID=1187941 RepID=UPI001E8D0823|nr:uncharacterized protein BKA58DRAFT_433959 [Alternaria rosae]KAH6882186.1 hypothetical protein BKA58DRAFT_433959 [Alternaria rosae]